MAVGVWVAAARANAQSPSTWTLEVHTVPGCPDRAAFVDRFVARYAFDPFRAQSEGSTVSADIQVRFDTVGRREYSGRLTTAGVLLPASHQFAPTRRCEALFDASLRHVRSLVARGPANTLYLRELPPAPSPVPPSPPTPPPPDPVGAEERPSTSVTQQQTDGSSVSESAVPSPVERGGLGVKLGLGGHWEAASAWSTLLTIGGYHAWRDWSLGAQAVVTLPLDATVFEAPVVGSLRLQRAGLALELCRVGRWSRVGWGACALAGATMWWGTFRQNNGESSRTQLPAAELGATARLEWPAQSTTRIWLGGAVSAGVPSLGWLAQRTGTDEPRLIAETRGLYLGMLVGVAISR
jgi:hypothetical protein